MALTPAMFSKVGEALFGPSWRIELSVALDVSERTVRRWQIPCTAIPDGIAGDLAVLCRKHSKRLDALAYQLEASSK